VLSGGEKARVALAKMLLRPSNLLVLDEPTNHLDLKSREVLEEALASYAGTLVFVSHDRVFVNALATRVLEVLPGQVEEHLGDYDMYLRRKSERAAAASIDAEVVPPTPGRAAAADAAAQARSPAASADAPAAPRPTKQQKQQARERAKARERVARRIERLEAQIAEEEARAEAAGYRLADPEIYSNAERLLEVQAEEQAIKSAVDALYRDWERLSHELAALEDAPA
jgi:ATP-binding cassette subfamily F protein 3